MSFLDTTRFTVELSPGGRGFLFDNVTGQVYTLNQSGCLAMQRLMQGETPAGAAEALASHYGTSTEQALADVLEFLTELSDLGVTG